MALDLLWIDHAGRIDLTGFQYVLPFNDLGAEVFRFDQGELRYLFTELACEI